MADVAWQGGAQPKVAVAASGAAAHWSRSRLDGLTTPCARRRRDQPPGYLTCCSASSPAAGTMFGGAARSAGQGHSIAPKVADRAGPLKLLDASRRRPARDYTSATSYRLSSPSEGFQGCESGMSTADGQHNSRYAPATSGGTALSVGARARTSARWQWGIELICVLTSYHAATG